MSSKKSIISGLHPEWREQLFEWKRANSPRSQKMLTAMAISQLTGLRPDELESTVELAYDEPSKSLAIVIKGSKVREEFDEDEQTVDRISGIKKRIIFVDANFKTSSSAAKFLVGAVLDGKARAKFEFKAKSYGDMYRQMLDAIKADKSSFFHSFNAKQRTAFAQTSPYAYRHAIAFDMLSCETMTRGEMAAVLGHKSTQTIEHYGRKRRSKTTKSPIKHVSVSREDFVSDPRLGQVVFNNKGVTAAGKLPRPSPFTKPSAPAKTGKPTM